MTNILLHCMYINYIAYTSNPDNLQLCLDDSLAIYHTEISFARFTRFSYCPSFAYNEQSGTCSSLTDAEVFCSRQHSTAHDSPLFTADIQVCFEVSPPSDTPTALFSSVSGEHQSHMARLNCAPIASAPAAAPLLYQLQLLLPKCVHFSCCSLIASTLACCSPIASA